MKPEDPRDIPENFSHMVGNGELVQDDAVVSRLERRIGSLDGQFLIPDDFDEMYAEEILDLFENGDRSMPEETTDSGTET